MGAPGDASSLHKQHPCLLCTGSSCPHKQGVCGDEESLWPTTDPVADAGRNQESEVPMCMWVRFGTAKNTVPGAPEAVVAVTCHTAQLS